MPDFKPNQARYREACSPHESPEKAGEEMNAFWDAVQDLRVKHRIRDLYVIYCLGVIEADGTETVVSGCTGLGTQSLWVHMTATAYGAEKAKHEANLRRLVAGKD